jgi:hypothetical protein
MPRVRPDWGRLRAVVLESDDWGLCAWSADDAAHRALAGLPAFRDAVGSVYGRSTLESAADVIALREALLEFRGADGSPPVWQANTVMGAPDFERLQRDGFAADQVPVVLLPATPGRWSRPGLWPEVEAAIAAGVWRPELHGLHHLPEHAWLGALRRGDADACAALAQSSPVCEAVQAGGEYDPAEPAGARAGRLERAFAHFITLFGRPPVSFCPPDYRWDADVEARAARLGATVLQGSAERAGPWSRLRRRLPRGRWPRRRDGLLLMPPRIAFEPRGDASPGSRLGAARAHAAARAAWARGEPAVMSTHRHNYAHLDPGWSEAGRRALRDLLRLLCEDGAVFLTDARVLDLETEGDAGR